MEETTTEQRNSDKAHVENIGGDKLGGDKITSTIGNVSGEAQVAIGKDIQQSRTTIASSEPFKTEEFLQTLRELKKIVAELEVGEDVKEDIEDNISNMRQEVKKAKEEKKEPDKNTLKKGLENTNAIVETLGKVGGLGAAMWPALQALAKFTGLPIP